MLLSVDRVSSVSAPSSCEAPAPESGRRVVARERAGRDRGLLARFHSGDETAFAEIMNTHRALVFAVAFDALRNRDDADEIVQDTFVRAHRALGTFRGDCSLATWLHRIALNLARNRYWYFFRRRRHTTVSLDCPMGPGGTATFADLIASDSAGPAPQAIFAEFTGLLEACMARLAAPSREILVLRNVRERSYEEIAAELGINVGTVKSRIARARAGLRDLLADACPEFARGAAPMTWFELERDASLVPVSGRC